nr:MAG TPA: hypothetical protein [Caudoviricetes sp.]
MCDFQFENLLFDFWVLKRHLRMQVLDYWEYLLYNPTKRWLQ